MIIENCRNTLNLHSTAFEVGKTIRNEALKNGLRKGLVLQCKKILTNHDETEKSEFLKGLMGFSDAITAD